MNRNKQSPEIKSGSKIKNSTKLFFSGVFVLTITNIIVKAIGLLFKIPMNNVVGDEGMGYYSSAYMIYTLLYMISTAGLPVAVSKMISESRAGGRIKQSRIVFKTAMLLFIGVGISGTLFMFFGAKWMSSVIDAPPTYLCIYAIAPTLFFICITSALRGYFQGYQQMTPTAISQFIEAVCKLLVGIIMAKYAIDQGYEIHIVAAYAAIGLTVGAILGMLFLTVAKLTFKESQYNQEYLDTASLSDDCLPTSVILKRLVIIAIPITLSASVMSLTNLIDTALVQRLLQLIGFSQADATTVYGNYTTLATPMFNLPPVLVTPIGYSIIPLIAVARERKDHARTKLIMESSLRVAVLIGMPCALGMAALSGPILHMFYKPSSAVMATPLLRLLAPSSLFVCILSVTNAILQASGHERKPLISMLVGAVVKVITNFTMILVIGASATSLGEIWSRAASALAIGAASPAGSTAVTVSTTVTAMLATPLSTFMCYLAVTVCNFYFVAKYAHIMPKFRRVFLGPLVSGAICAGVAIGAYTLLETVLSVPLKLAVLVAIAAAAFVYLILIFMTHSITNDDIRLLPKGERLLSILAKLHLVKD